MSNDVTVLIPTFQRAKYLDFLLESISKQTIEGQIDCLISDANSKDNTLEIIKKWDKNKKLSIEVIKNKNDISPIENWKNLVDNSKTKYSKIIFDDDWMEPNCLEEMKNLLIEKKSEVVITNFNAFFDDGQIRQDNFKRNYINMDSKYLNTNDIINYYLLNGKKINVSPTGAFYKTKIMKEAFEFGLDLNDICTEKAIGIDLIMNFYPIFKNKNVFFTSESLVNCRAHDSSISVKTDNRVLYYCYLKSLFKLINKFSIQLNNEQNKALKRKLLIYRFRKTIKPKYDIGLNINK
tara:strand:- start:29375 stop:30253 length:879 start_codon:yes stop_codon:yes gene_type:complete